MSAPIPGDRRLTPSEAALLVIAAVTLIAALRVAAEVLLPIALALLLGFSLSPIVGVLHRYRVPRFLGAGVVTLALLAALALLGYGLRDQAGNFMHQLPLAAQKVKALLIHHKAEPVKQLQRAAGEIEQATRGAPAGPGKAGTPVQVVPAPRAWADLLWPGTKGVALVAAQAAVVFFLLYFFLTYADLYKRKLVRIAGPSLHRRRVTMEIVDEIHRQIERFMFAQLLGGILVAAALWLCYRLIGLDNAAMWGVVSGVFKLLPYLGPIVTTAAATVAAFVQFDSVSQATTVAAVTLIVTNLEGNLLIPWLTGKMAHMNGAVVFVSLLFWGWVWGALGVLLAVPIMMVIKVICDRVESLRAVGELLGE